LRSSEHGQRLLDQMELQLQGLEASAAEDQAAIIAADTTSVVGFTRRQRYAHRCRRICRASAWSSPRRRLPVLRRR
jgi:hypothetical protein